MNNSRHSTTKTDFVKYYRYIIQSLFFLGLFFLPLIFWPKATIPYEIPKVWFVNRWIEVIGLSGFLFSFSLLKKKEKSSIFMLLVIVFIFVAIISSLLGVDLTKSIWGNYYRGDGLYTLFHLTGLFLFIFLYWQDNWKYLLAKAVVLGSFLTSIIATYFGFRLHILGDATVPNWNKAIGVSFGQPNFAGGYFLIALPFNIYLMYTAKTNTSRFFWITVFLVQLIALALTRSIGAILGLLLLVWLITLFCHHIKKPAIWIVSFAFFVLGAVLMFNYLYRNAGFLPEGRPRIVRKVLLGAAKRPILGWGWANVDYAFKEVPYPLYFQHDVYLDKAHSTLLEIFTTTGIIGLSIYLALIFLALRKLYLLSFSDQKVNLAWYRMLLVSFILYLFHSQTNVISIAEEISFWLILGIAASSPIYHPRYKW